jgi:hypothetical protein
VSRAICSLAELQHEVTEILEQHAGGPEEGGQALDVGQPQEGADEAKAVEAAEGALNLVVMSRYKGLHGVVSGTVRDLLDFPYRNRSYAIRSRLSPVTPIRSFTCYSPLWLRPKAAL